MTASGRHLDLGCGKFPRNPYGLSEVYGIDIRPPPVAVNFEHRVANLALEPIPFADDTFASISAFDFIEHVPRVLTTADGSDTLFPFVRLMQEVWRVLVPDGRFYAVTPAFPSPDAFVDPTHVNIITERTHEYFCGAQPSARMYGFNGQFVALRAEWVHIHDVYSTITGSPENRRRHTGLKKFSREVRAQLRSLRGKPEPGHGKPKIYFLWELKAVKPIADQ